MTVGESSPSGVFPELDPRSYEPISRPRLIAAGAAAQMRLGLSLSLISMPESVPGVIRHSIDGPLCGCPKADAPILCNHLLALWALRGHPQITDLYANRTVAISGPTDETVQRAQLDASRLQSYTSLRAELRRGTLLRALDSHRVLLDPACGPEEWRRFAGNLVYYRNEAWLLVRLAKPLGDSETRARLLGCDDPRVVTRAFSASTPQEVASHLAVFSSAAVKTQRAFWRTLASRGVSLPAGISPHHLLPYLRHSDATIRRDASVVLGLLGLARRCEEPRSEGIIEV